MTVKEKPLFGEVTVQAYNGSTWYDLTPEATGISIRRGGVRDGLGVKTDVGLCSFVLKNAEDPMSGGTLTPGQAVRVLGPGYVPPTTVPVYSATFDESGSVYNYGFEPTGVDSWFGASTTVARSTLSPRVGTACLKVDNTAIGNGSARRTLTGLVIGHVYAFGAWVSIAASGITWALGVSGIGSGTLSASTVGTYTYRSYTFTATATSHIIEVRFNSSASPITIARIDDVQVWDETAPYDGWVPVAPTAVYHLPGSATVEIDHDGGAPVQRVMGGLTVGKQYTLSAWSASWLSPNWDSPRSVGVLGKGAGTPITVEEGTATYTFTATATSHTLQLFGPASGFAASQWDDIALVENVPAVPNELFTGRITDIASTYPLDKQRNISRALVTVTVADAVQSHVTTPRYGVQIAEGFETFESRINRLSGSALAPIEVPTEGAPTEVYSF